MFVEKRKHKRLNLQIEAKLEDTDGNIYKGKTNNISFGGLFIELSPVTLNKDDKCNITLLLNTDESENIIPIAFECKIVHARKKGYGVQYICIDGLDAYNHFEKLMVLNSDEPEILMTELEKNPGLIVKK